MSPVFNYSKYYSDTIKIKKEERTINIIANNHIKTAFYTDKYLIIELIDEHIYQGEWNKNHHNQYPQPTFHHIMIYDKNTLPNQDSVSLNTLTLLFKIKIPLVEPYKFEKFFAELFHVKKDNRIVLKREINKKYI